MSSAKAVVSLRIWLTGNSQYFEVVGPNWTLKQPELSCVDLFCSHCDTMRICCQFLREVV